MLEVAQKPKKCKKDRKKSFKNLHRLFFCPIFALAIQQKGITQNGALVQLVRIRACHARGQGFESPTHRQRVKQFASKPWKSITFKVFCFYNTSKIPHNIADKCGVIRGGFLGLEKNYNRRTKQRQRWYHVDDIVQIFETQLQGQTLFSFMQGVISRLRELRKQRCVETYTTTLNSFMRFREGADIALSELSADLLQEYEAWLKFNEAALNTVCPWYIDLFRSYAPFCYKLCCHAPFLPVGPKS